MPLRSRPPSRCRRRGTAGRPCASPGPPPCRGRPDGRSVPPPRDASRWVEHGVSRDSPERLFQLGRGEEEPSVDLRPCSKPAGEQAFLGVLLRQVEDDRDRLRENEVAIDEDRQLSSRVQREKLGPPEVALGGVYVDELELDIQLAQRPEDADRTGRREPIELHGVAVSFGPERRPRSGAWPAVGSILYLVLGRLT